MVNSALTQEIQSLNCGNHTTQNIIYCPSKLSASFFKAVVLDNTLKVTIKLLELLT